MNLRQSFSSEISLLLLMSSMSSSRNPWTAIILHNEEYFLALEELKMRGHPLLDRLPIVRIRGRKMQFGDHFMLSHDPWEKDEEWMARSLSFDYDAEEYKAFYNLQAQAKKHKQRGLEAVYIHYLELQFDNLLGDHFPYIICFELTEIPRGSQSHREMKTQVSNYVKEYGLYEQMRQSKRGMKEYKKRLESPSCLEIKHVVRINPNPFTPTEVTSRYLDGLTKQSQEFLHKLMIKTRTVIWCAYKVPSTTEGFILDGLIRPPT